MCGIVGYVGHREAEPILVEGLRRLEYRGYDSAGISPRHPELVVGARLGSPLVLGLGQKENFLASDPAALIGNTERVVYLKDQQMCVLTPDDWHILDRHQARVEADVQQIDW